MKLAGYEISESEVEFSPIRASGPGGQHVNKVSSAVHLRFDINASSLPDHCKQKLLAVNDQRISSDGIVIIKARQYRSQEKNRAEALSRLDDFLSRAVKPVKPRRITRPSKASRMKRMDKKKIRGRVKNLRGSKNLQDM